jgi:hypothetical protein
MRNIALLLFVVAAIMHFWPQSGGPDTGPGEVDLYPAFTSQSDNHAQSKVDALEFGALCQSLSDMIKSDKDRITTGSQLDELRQWARYYQRRGERYGRHYPMLAEVVGEYLTSKCGVSPGPLDQETKAKYVEAYRQLAIASRHAASRL